MLRVSDRRFWPSSANAHRCRRPPPSVHRNDIADLPVASARGGVRPTRHRRAPRAKQTVTLSSTIATVVIAPVVSHLHVLAMAVTGRFRFAMCGRRSST
jgi:hypothetical protein